MPQNANETKIRELVEKRRPQNGSERHGTYRETMTNRRLCVKALAGSAVLGCSGCSAGCARCGQQMRRKTPS
jgi:hypothetical protein